MADDGYAELLTTIRLVLLSAKRSVELALPGGPRAGPEDAAVLKQFLLALESARLTFRGADRSARPVPVEQSRSFLIETLKELNEIVADERFRTVLRRPFRLTQTATANREPQKMLPGFEARDISLAVAFGRLIEYISVYGAPKDSSQVVQDLFELRSIVPKQKIAPAQFDIKENRLIVSRRASPFSEDDRQSISSAKVELQKNNKRIIQELERSNCDRRLLENVQQLQQLLDDETDAIKIGLANLGCAVMSANFEHELPTAVASMLKAHTRGIDLFVGQFPEWNKFLENAASVQIDASDVSAIKAASDQVVAELKGRPDLVDPEVPRTLSHLSELLRSPSAAGRRAAFAVLRSVENLISVIYSFGADFAQKTTSKTVDQASTMASKLIVRALLAIALAGAASIGPFAGKVPEMHWLHTASEIVKKQLEKLAAE